MKLSGSSGKKFRYLKNFGFLILILKLVLQKFSKFVVLFSRLARNDEQLPNLSSYLR